MKFAAKLCAVSVFACAPFISNYVTASENGSMPQVERPDGKEADMSKPVQVFILLGQSNMVGLGKVDTLTGVVKGGKYPFLVDESGNWIERKDVRFVRMMTGKLLNNEWMKVGGKHMGPEYGIGFPLGQTLDAPVMILKSCIGNRSIGWDLLPPGSEPYEFNGKLEPGYRGTPKNPQGNGQKVEGEWYAGKQWDTDTEDAQAVLAKLQTYYPGAKGFEVAGFFFWQGEKDCGNPAHSERYEFNLVNFIKALRKEFNAPDAKFVCATLGEAKKGSGGNGGKVLAGHLAVDGDSGKYPEFKGNVATVYSNPLSKGGSGNSHYGGNPETYMDVGLAMGWAMVKLLNESPKKKAEVKEDKEEKAEKEAKVAKPAVDPKVARANMLLKTAKEADDAGQLAVAKTFYQQVIKEFSGTEAAQNAEERLKSADFAK